MLEKAFSAMNNVFSAMDKTFKIVEEELTGAFKDAEKSFKKKTNLSGKTKIRIGKGSKVIINGAIAQLLGDVIVATDDPNTLMCLNKDSNNTSSSTFSTEQTYEHSKTKTKKN
jgi:hypothetical protein